MLTLALVALLADAPGVAEKPKLILTDLTAGAGVDAKVTGPLTEAIASELGARGYFQVVTQQEVSTMLGLERQKQLMGCSDEAKSCFAELSGALGARFVMNGSVAKLGDAYQLTLSTLDTQKAQPLGRAVRLSKDLGALQAQLPFAVAEATATPLPPPPSRVLPYTLIGTGTAAILFGGVWGILAISNESSLRDELSVGMNAGGLLSQTRTHYEGRANQIQLNKIIALSAIGAGAVLLAVGLGINPSDTSGGGAVALVPTANGVALVGVLP